jgi:type II secretory pathway component GspD/PulD (secretin)
MTFRTLFFALGVCLSQPLLAATEVMPLNYRTADDVLPVVQSVLGNEGRASNYGNQLIVNAPPAKLQEVRDLLKQIDKQPKRLLISVDTSDSNQMNQQGYSANGTISAGNADVQVGRGEVNGRDQVRIINRSTQSRSGGTQQVQTTEGYPALIQVGQSVPLTNTSVDSYGRPYNSTEYRNVTRGFYVTASLTGDTVHISIANNNDRLSQTQQGAIDIQNTDTKVTGRLGEWITIGGVNENAQSDQNGFVQRRSTQGRDDMTLRVKVDALD